jgi:anti-sigma B factor antagonist
MALPNNSDTGLEVYLWQPRRGAIIVKVAGQLDLESSPMLRAELVELIDAGCEEVVIDVADLGFVDSSGLSVLLMAHRALKANGGGLEIRNPPPRMRKLLDISGIDRFIPTTVYGETAGTHPTVPTDPRGAA